MAAPIVLNIVNYIQIALLVGGLILMLAAFIHAALQPAEGYAAIGGFSKVAWLAIVGGCFLLALLTGWGGLLFLGPLPMFIGIGFSVFYFVDTRVGIKDATEGHW